MHTLSKEKHVAVIGSGFGGLALAIRMQAQGFRVSLFEKREKIGGRAYQFKEKGYTFDMGPSLITAPSIIDAVFQSAGESMHNWLDLTPLDPFYRVYSHDGTFFDYNGNREQMKAQMRQFNVQDAENYDAFMKKSKEIYDVVITERKGSQPFETPGSVAKFIPTFMKMKAYLPVYHHVKRYFKDERHRFLFSFHPLFIGGNPFSVPSIYLMIPFLEKQEGVWFTKGGMYSLIESFGKLFDQIGGKIYPSSEVSKILVENGKTTGLVVNGEKVDADIVVSNADVGHTYQLISPTHRHHWKKKKLDRVSYTMSCFLLYIGVRKIYPNLKHHTLILSPRYRELIKDIFSRKILPDDFSMYLHAPSKTDPDMAPEGCESLYVLIPVANLASNINWQEIGVSFGQQVLQFLEKWGLDGLREHTEVLKMFTPEDFKDRFNATYGNAFGVEPQLLQTAYWRPHNTSEDVKGLYMVGASTHPGAGVPGVLLSAETTASCIQRDFVPA